MRCAVIVFPGSNCDVDLFKAADRLEGASAEYVWHTETDLRRFDAILLPGGFTYGDYLRPGALAAVSPVIQSVLRAADAGKLVLGICNGFQILLETKLLPGTLLPNRQLTFICDLVPTQVTQADSPFTQAYAAGETLHLPIAHGSGNYFCDEATLADLEAHGQIAFRYPEGFNPNGSVAGITGILNRQKNVLGMMPHPERAMSAWMGSADGTRLFQSMLRHLQN
jgi:phosphoribosylformylglycinamidine synthase